MDVTPPASTRIVRVVVHRNGALVTRQGQAEPGPVEITDLPLLFAADTLRVRPTRGAVRDLVDTCRTQRAGGGDGAAAESLQAAQDRVEDLRRACSRLENRVRRAELLRPQPPGEDPLAEAPDAAALLALHDAASSRLTALQGAKQDAVEALQAALRAEAVARAAADAERDAPRFTRGIAFVIDAEGDAPVEFEVEYFVSAARWVPAYRLDIGREHGLDVAQLRLDGLVAQASGEDWDDAEVRLATADLSRATTLPQLRSWRIGARQPAPPPAWRPLPPGLDALFAGFDAIPKPLPRRPTPRPQADDFDDTEEREAEPHPAKRRPQRTSAAALGGARPSPRPANPPARPPAPAAAPPPPPQAEPFADGARARGYGGGGEPDAERMGISPPNDGLAPGLRHAYLRMAGPDESDRGTLHPVVPLTHLWSLVEHEPGADLSALRRAVDALEVAQRKLWSRPLPAGGCRVADGFHHVYAAAGRARVPGDASWHRVAGPTFSGPLRTEFRTVPRADTQVYRFVEIDAPEAPLPTGPLEVYVDDRFKTSSQLSGTGGGELVALNLGVEPGLRVVERTAHVQQSDRGLMNTSTRVEHRVVVRVRSGLRVPARVVVYDRLPYVPEGVKDVEVELVGSTPVPERDDQGPRGRPLEGGVHWPLMVAPGEVGALEYTYQVTFPSRHELAGGNRRE